MDPTIIPREQVAQRLAVPIRLLVGYERRGFVRAVRVGEVEGYPPEELPRVWTIVSLHRDARINLAGVEAVLRLRSQMRELHRRLGSLAERMDALLAEADDARP